MDLVPTLVRHFEGVEIDADLWFRISDSSYKIMEVTREGIRFNYANGDRGRVLQQTECGGLVLTSVEIEPVKGIIPRGRIYFNSEWVM